MLVPDEVRKCAAFLLYKGSEGIKLAGTAFFVGMPMEDIEGQFVYLVSARHIIDKIVEKSIDQRIYIRLNLRDKPAQLAASDIDKWFFHEGGISVDVAVLPWAPPIDVVDYLTLQHTSIATDEIIAKEQIGVGDEVFLTGLFAEHYGRNKNLPIIRIGNIALMPDEPIQTRDLGLIDAYLIEARSIGGLSGSPVFVHLSGMRRSTLAPSRFYLLGLMHGHWDLPLMEIDDIREDSLVKERVNMGIAIVVPATKIIEVLNQKELIEQRNKEMEKKRKEKES